MGEGSKEEKNQSLINLFHMKVLTESYWDP